MREALGRYSGERDLSEKYLWHEVFEGLIDEKNDLLYIFWRRFQFTKELLPENSDKIHSMGDLRRFCEEKTVVEVRKRDYRSDCFLYFGEVELEGGGEDEIVLRGYFDAGNRDGS